MKLARLAAPLLVPNVLFFLLGTICVGCVSDMLLTRLGIPYNESPGKQIFKVHPASYLFFLSLLLTVVRRGGLARSWRLIAVEHRAVGFYLLCCGIVFLVQAIIKGQGEVSIYIDTMFSVGFALVVFPQLPERVQRLVFVILVALLTLNAVIALGESVLHTRLIPWYAEFAGHKVEIDDHRATALLGFPLTNGLITVCGVAVVSGTVRGFVLRNGIILLLLLACLAFGARAATAMSVLVLAAMIAVRVASIVLGRTRLRQTDLIAALALGIIVPATGIVVTDTSFGQSFLQRLADDNGSAGSRLTSIDALSAVTSDELLIGVPPERFDSVNAYFGLDAGIENPWVISILRYGLLLFPVYLVGMGCLFAIWTKGGGAAFTIAAIAFFIVASGNNSIATKTMSPLYVTLLIASGRVFEYRARLAALAHRFDRMQAEHYAVAVLGRALTHG